jgi:hypothetical protein
MKSFNKKLATTSGLFIALCALTSFNPFSQAKHLAAQEKEESISLAENSEGRTGTHDSGEGTNNDKKRLQAKIDEMNAIRLRRQAEAQGQPTTTGAGVLHDVVVKPAGAQTATITTTSGNEAGTTGNACPDGKCGSSEKTPASAAITDLNDRLKKLNPEEQAAFLKQLKQDHDEAAQDDQASSSDDTPANKCDGAGDSTYRDYSARASCFLETEKTLKKKSEDYGNLAEEMDAFISEVTLDEDLKDRQVTQILSKLSKSKIVRSDRDLGLKNTIRVAMSYKDAQKDKLAFQKNLENSADEISGIDNQLSQMNQYNNGMNPQMNYQTNMLQIQRKQAVYNLESNVAAFQQKYRMSLPAGSTDDSPLVSTLRENMSADYNDLISPIAPVLSDKRLISLDAHSFSIANIQNGTQGGPGVQGGVYSSQNGPNGIPQLGQTGSTYSGSDPYMANANTAMLAQMTPAQQIQQLQNQLRNGGVANNAVPFGQQTQIPGQYQQIPGPGPQQFPQYH